MGIQPERALAHPVWVGALVVLLANDHVLKGAAILPVALTGKLSDVAGLIVAPILLASLLRLRSQRGLMGSHLAVGLVFTALQLSSAVSESWAVLWSTFAWGWSTTMDPTDLLALPALGLSWAVLVPAAQRRTTVAPAWRATLLGLGTLGCVATSQSDRERDTSWGWADIQAVIYLHNANDTTTKVSIRALRSDIKTDCEQIGLDPAMRWVESAFEPAAVWELPPGTNVPLVTDISPCGAAIVTTGESPPKLVFWKGAGSVLDLRTHAGEEEGRSTSPAAVNLVGDSLTAVTQGVLWDWRPLEDGAETCEDLGGRHGLDWTLSTGTYTLTSIEEGVDGCFALGLDGNAANQYLCLPASLFVFEVGETVDIGVSGEYLSVTGTDQMLALHRGRDSNLVMAGLRLKQSTALGEPCYRDACPKIARTVGVSVTEDGIELAQLHPIDQPTVVIGNRLVQVVFSERRSLWDSSCDSNDETNLEWAVLQGGAP